MSVLALAMSVPVGGICRGRAIMTGIVVAVVVRSSACGEIRHASGRGSIDIVVSSSAVVVDHRRVGIGVPMAGKTFVKVVWVSAAREAGTAYYSYDIPFVVCGALWSWYFMAFPPLKKVISWSWRLHLHCVEVVSSQSGGEAARNNTCSRIFVCGVV